jgi:hypothetical protein
VTIRGAIVSGEDPLRRQRRLRKPPGGPPGGGAAAGSSSSTPSKDDDRQKFDEGLKVDVPTEGYKPV